MTKNSMRNKLNKTDGKYRSTPKDLEVRGTFAQAPAPPKEEPRPPTPEEMRGNNISAVEYGRMVFAMWNWVPMFVAELEEMNRGKVGRPYGFPDSLIIWILRVMALTGLSFRLVSGLSSSIMALFGFPSPSYSRLQERAALIGEGIAGETVQQGLRQGVFAVVACGNVSERVRSVGIDSTGLNLSSTSLWRKRKWNTGPKDLGWLKLHALSDVDSGEIIAYAVTDDSVGDAPLLRVLVGAASEKGHRFGTVYADGAYSSNDNWIYLCRENGYRFVTSFRSNTRPTKNGCQARGEAARLWCSLPYREWKKVSGYGKRWKCEGVFSDFKRFLGEVVTNRSKAGMLAQIASKILTFNEYKVTRAGIIGITGNEVALA